MALWAYTLRFPDGREEERMLAAGNLDAAKERAAMHARNFGAALVGEIRVTDKTRGSM